MDASGWDERYSGKDLAWSRDPNRWVVQEMAGNAPGRALDLATGEGRNAIWLAEVGWSVTAVDFSQAGLARAKELAKEAGAERGEVLDITWICGDLMTMDLPVGAFDLVLMSYLHLPSYDRRTLVRKAATAVAPGGVLLVIGHDATNLEEGYGGPQDPDVLFTGFDLDADLLDQLGSGALTTERAARVAREVDTDDGPRVAWDVVYKARRRDMTKGEFTFGAPA